MEQTPLVSVLTPSLDQADFLGEAIRSVAGQDYPRLEHVIADGGSTDGTVAILERHGDVRWWSRPDGGQSEALNEALAASNGEIVGWLNADDMYLPGAVAAAVEALRANPRAGVVYGDWVVVDERGDRLRSVQPGPFDLYHALNVGNIVPQPAAFIRRAVLDEVGFVDPDLHYAMDYDLWLRIARAGHPLVYVPGYWAAFRLHSGSKTRAQGGRFWAEERAVMLRHGGRRLSRGYVSHQWYATVFRARWLVRPLVPEPVRQAIRRRR